MVCMRVHCVMDDISCAAEMNAEMNGGLFFNAVSRASIYFLGELACTHDIWSRPRCEGIGVICIIVGSLMAL